MKHREHLKEMRINVKEQEGIKHFVAVIGGVFPSVLGKRQGD